MSISRIFQPVSLTIGDVIHLDEKASHHILRVLRAEKGDKLILFNGLGGEYEGLMTGVSKKTVSVSITSFSERERESPIEIHLAQGIARGEKMDFIVQKAVELGVNKIIPLITERSNVRLAAERQEKRLQHWQSVVISACEQCGRNRLPVLQPPISLEGWLATVSQEDRCFVLSPHASEKLSPETIPKRSRLILLIGPEGGLSEGEIQKATQKGFSPLNLGPRILRTETATLAAISILQWVHGDMGG